MSTLPLRSPRPAPLRAIALSAALLAAALPSTAATPRDGALDAGFGRDGIVVTDFPANNDFDLDVAAQADGKLLLLSDGGGPGPGDLRYTDCRLIRFLADGRLDPSFGDGGAAHIRLRRTVSTYSGCARMALQPDGRILVVGGNDADLFVLRYSASGVRDASFGRDGIVTADTGQTEWPYAIALQPDGKFVIGANGYADSGRSGRLLTFRYRADGEPDAGFGRGGWVTGEYPEQRTGAHGSQLALQPDGKIVVAGETWRANLLVRYLPDGRLDPSFGAGGSAISRITGLYSGAEGLVLQTDGSFITSHVYVPDPQSYSNGTLLRHRPDGRLDTTFHHPHIKFWGPIARQADGRILAIASGMTGDGPLLERYNPDGSRDAGFVVAPPAVDPAYWISYGGLAPLPDGRIAFVASLIGEGRMLLTRLHNTTYCLSDPADPERYLGFSPSGWFAAAEHGAGVTARGRVRSAQWPGQPLAYALSAGGPAPAAYRIDAFASVEGAQGFGFANIAKRNAPTAHFGVVDARINDPGCGVRPGG